MKKNPLGMVVGVVLLILFAIMLFVEQIRVTEVAVRTRFGKVVEPIVEPGIKFKLPWPIERIQKFDRRKQNFEDKFEETLTQDGRNLMIEVYLGWSIEQPEIFRERFIDGSVAEAQRNLEGMVRSAKNEVVGSHPFSDFINTDDSELKFAEIEDEILAVVRDQAESTYGIKIHFLGIKRLGLPDNITTAVFDRMRAERQKLVRLYESEGESEATRIRTTADRDRAEKLAAAEAEATRIRGEADAQAAQAYGVLQQNPELAMLLLKLNALEMTLKDRATLILDDRTPPFDLLREQSFNGN